MAWKQDGIRCTTLLSFTNTHYVTMIYISQTPRLHYYSPFKVYKIVKHKL